MFAIYFLYLFVQIKTTLIEEAEPETFWEGLVNVFLVSSIGSYYLAWAGILLLVWFIFLIVGIIVLKRSRR